MTGIFSKPKAPPLMTVPEVKPPAPLPDDQSPEVLESKRRAMAELGRLGRPSTILTNPRTRSGTPTIADYTKRTLGGDA
jgi:hypothetical protein